MRKYLTIRAWEEANPYEEICDEERCVWLLMRKKGRCPHCENPDLYCAEED